LLMIQSRWTTWMASGGLSVESAKKLG